VDGLRRTQVAHLNDEGTAALGVTPPGWDPDPKVGLFGDLDDDYMQVLKDLVADEGWVR
jgi:hypothetical protein